MDPQNLKSLEKLSLYCYYCGILPIFLGVLIVFMDIIEGAYGHILIGVFIFVSGYAFVKISSKLSLIIKKEQTVTGSLTETPTENVTESKAVENKTPESKPVESDSKKDKEKIRIGDKEYTIDDFNKK